MYHKFQDVEKNEPQNGSGKTKASLNSTGSSSIEGTPVRGWNFKCEK